MFLGFDTLNLKFCDLKLCKLTVDIQRYKDGDTNTNTNTNDHNNNTTTTTTTTTNDDNDNDNTTTNNHNYTERPPPPEVRCNPLIKFQLQCISFVCLCVYLGSCY